MSVTSTESGSENGASKVAPGYELEKEKASLLGRLSRLKEDFNQAALCMSAQNAKRISNTMDELEIRVTAIDAELKRLTQDTPRPFMGPTFSSTPPE